MSRRQKRVVDDTDRLATAAVLNEQSTSGASSYLSVKQSPATTFSAEESLTSICLDVLVEHFSELLLDTRGQFRRNDAGAVAAKGWIHLYPVRVCNKLLRLLLDNSQRTVSGARISASAISEIFLRPAGITAFTLPCTYFRAAQPQYDASQQVEEDPENELLGSIAKDKRDVNREQAALRRAAQDRLNLMTALSSCTSLRLLNLSGQAKLEDTVLASLFESTPHLEEVILRGCIDVGDKSLVALSRTAGAKQNLKTLNLNFAAVTVKGLKSLISRCKSLQVLKLGSINGLTDDAIAALLDPGTYVPGDWKASPFLNLTSLKLRSTKIGDAGLRAILPLTPVLERLDISYTKIRSLDILADFITTSQASPSGLVKLSISGLTLRRDNELDRLFNPWSRLPDVSLDRLRTLKMGSLNMPQTYFHDAALRRVLTFLQSFSQLEKVSLFGNKTLSTGSAVGLRDFIGQVGRRCDTLDLSTIPLTGRQLSAALLDYFENEDGSVIQPRLRVLLLNNCRIDDEACYAISTLSNLEELHIEQATITVEGMNLITAGCANLRVVNLTGCRGIPTRERREWFETHGRHPEPALLANNRGKRQRRR